MFVKGVGCWVMAVISIYAIAAFDCFAAEKTKLAEGEYGVVRSPSKLTLGKTIDQWTLWRLPYGRLQVESRLPRWARERYRQAGTSVVQRFTFARKMELAGYELHLISSDEQVDLYCDLRPKLIRCRGPQLGRAELKVEKSPYAFCPGEFYGLDLDWFLASLIHGEVRTRFETPAYWLELPDVDTKMEIVPDQPLQVKYLGRERIRIMRKQVDANKYELGDEQGTIWTAQNNGMVLALGVQDSHASSKVTGEDIGRVELVKFKSYSPTFNLELQ